MPQKCPHSTSNGIRTAANKCGIAVSQLENCSIMMMAFAVVASLYITKLGCKNNQVVALPCDFVMALIFYKTISLRHWWW